MKKKDQRPPPWNYIDPYIPFAFDLIHPEELPTGVPGIAQNIPIDLMKFLTLFFCLFVSYYYDNYTDTMMVYTALHGAYGWLWAAKSILFPDAKWNKPVPLSSIIVTVLGLGMYWIIPYRIAVYRVEKSSVWLGLAIFMNVLGVFMHYCSDMQKSIELKHKPGVLIKDRFFALCRHPNYFGEGLIYTSFTMLSDSWIMTVYFVVFVLIYWVPNIWWKERSMARYPGWNDYTKKVKTFVPFIY